MHKKSNGSYYTPGYLADFMLKHIANDLPKHGQITLLEPSVGDGSFIRAFNKTAFSSEIKSFSFTGVEKIKPELEKAKAAALQTKKQHAVYSFIWNDFLQFQKNLTRKFSVIAGNPPYIKKSHLNKVQIAACNEINLSANLSEVGHKNIWPAFVIRCSQLLENDGILALVLPAELLQVKFSAPLRNFLSSLFDRIEIFTFDDLLFECKGQDTVLLFAYKQHSVSGQFYAHISNIAQLNNNKFVLNKKEALVSTDTKWTHHTLSDDELNFLHRLGRKLNSVDHFCQSKPGIVTAANNFFIVNDDVANIYNLNKYARPIILKGLFVNGSVVFREKEYQVIQNEGKPSKVLVFQDSDAGKFSKKVSEYILYGEELDLPNRYKCKKRDNWFVIPNISTVPEGFFFKRTHHYPKLMKNEADVLVTDTAYKIEMKDGYNIESLIYSFYNSLTLAFAELDGRYYGGGVLELMPSEFKKLPIPNVPVTKRQFKDYSVFFENKKDISEVLQNHDEEILSKSLTIGGEDVNKIRSIYKKLVEKRFRVKETVVK